MPGRRLSPFARFQQSVDVVLRRALAIRSPNNAQRKTATEAPVTSSSTPGLTRFNTLADGEATPALHQPARQDGPSSTFRSPKRAES
ncbi:hypothetical protein ACWEQJ_05690, partial [Streptomyces cyaneofuscatus]